VVVLMFAARSRGGGGQRPALVATSPTATVPAEARTPATASTAAGTAVPANPATPAPAPSPIPVTRTPVTVAGTPVAAPTAPPNQTAPAGIASAIESDVRARGYTPIGPLVAVPASAAGDTLYVQRGACAGAADGCQRVFIRWNDHFLGTDTREDSEQIVSVVPAGTAQFAVTYIDPATGAPVAVTYTCDASRCYWSRTPPGHDPRG
jgi:hypothetical protein